MPRRNVPKKREILPDSVYNSFLASLFINRILKKGKKSLARKIFYEAMKEIKEKTNSNPLKVFEKAVAGVTPKVEVKSRRLGGAVYQVPTEVDQSRGTALALKWILEAAKSRRGTPIIQNLVSEILSASNGTGTAVKKKDEMHRMAETNKTFSHYRF